MATLKEKIGYGFGDMSSSMFWKIFSAYLPIFYATVFHLSLEVTGVLMLVTRIWDAVSDPMMGIIADRTSTRWGKYRPYLLWIAVPFAVAGVLLFTKPAFGETGNTVWAFVTYILMMTVYTAINVPYGSMLGVMTEDSDEKTVFSSFRMFFAYAGSFIVLALWEPLCNYFAASWGALNEGETLTRDPQAWQYGADAGEGFSAQQGIDQRAFAHVGAPGKGDLHHGICRKLADLSCADAQLGPIEI